MEPPLRLAPDCSSPDIGARLSINRRVVGELEQARHAEGIEDGAPTAHGPSARSEDGYPTHKRHKGHQATYPERSLCSLMIFVVQRYRPRTIGPATPDFRLGRLGDANLKSAADSILRPALA